MEHCEETVDIRNSGGPGFFARWFMAADHRRVGTLYLIFAICAGLIGGAISGMMRAELTAPGPHYPPALASWLGMQHAANGQALHLWTMLIAVHGLIMVFFVVMPAMIGGFGTWFVPLMIGAPDMAFPRANLLGFWLTVAGFCSLMVSAFVPDGAGPAAAVSFAILSLLLAGAGSIMGAINFITTIINMRAPGMTLHRMPLFVWAMLVTAFLLLLALPVLAAVATMLIADPHFSMVFFDSSGGGDPALFQHLFWFFGHPEVYIMLLPGFGMISQIVATFAKRPVFAYLGMVYAMVAIGVIGFVAWADHMYTSGLSGDPRLYFAAAAMVVAVPTGMMIVSWLVTMRGGSVTFKSPMVWAIGFMVLFTAGGVAGMVLAHDGAGDGVRGTYYAVAHFHYVLSLSAVTALFAGFYYWFPRMSGRLCSEALALLHFALFFIGVNMIFLPMYVLGAQGVAGHGPDDAPRFTGWSHLTSAGYMVMAVSIIVWLVNSLHALLSGKKAGGDCWGEGAVTLEWAPSSPPPPRRGNGL